MGFEGVYFTRTCFHDDTIFAGSGKSALVANWAKRVEDAEPETFMFVHFIGSSADSADYMKLIRRFVSILISIFELNF